MAGKGAKGGTLRGTDKGTGETLWQRSSVVTKEVSVSQTSVTRDYCYLFRQPFEE